MTNRKKFEIFQGLTARSCVAPSGPRVPRGGAAGGGILEAWGCAPEHQVSIRCAGRGPEWRDDREGRKVGR
jgi:hypothetical protein